MAYKGGLTTAFDLVQVFGSGAFSTAVAFNKWELAKGADDITITYYYFQSVKSMMGRSLIQPVIVLTFQFNFASQSYDLAVSSGSFTYQGMLNSYITIMMTANEVLLMQQQDGGLRLRYN